MLPRSPKVRRRVPSDEEDETECSPRRKKSKVEPSSTPPSSSLVPPSTSIALQSFSQQSHLCLLPLLPTVLIPIVMSYAFSIELTFLRTFGRKGAGDGQMHPQGLAFSQEELFLVDRSNHRIQ